MAADKFFTYEMTNGTDTVLLMATSPNVDALARDADAKNRAAVGGFKVSEGSLREHDTAEARNAFVVDYRKAHRKSAEPGAAELKRNRERVFGKIDVAAAEKAAAGAPSE